MNIGKRSIIDSPAHCASVIYNTLMGEEGLKSSESILATLYLSRYPHPRQEVLLTNERIVIRYGDKTYKDPLSLIHKVEMRTCNVVMRAGLPSLVIFGAGLLFTHWPLWLCLLPLGVTAVLIGICGLRRQRLLIHLKDKGKKRVFTCRNSPASLEDFVSECNYRLGRY